MFEENGVVMVVIPGGCTWSSGDTPCTPGPDTYMTVPEFQESAMQTLNRVQYYASMGWNWSSDEGWNQARSILSAAYAATTHGLDCIGVGGLVQGGTMAASAPILSKPFTMAGSSPGTSVASSLAGDYVGTQMTVPVGMPGTSSFRWTTTAKWGRAGGRMLPYVGTAVAIYAMNSCLVGD